MTGWTRVRSSAAIALSLHDAPPPVVGPALARVCPHMVRTRNCVTCLDESVTPIAVASAKTESINSQDQSNNHTSKNNESERSKTKDNGNLPSFQLPSIARTLPRFSITSNPTLLVHRHFRTHRWITTQELFDIESKTQGSASELELARRSQPRQSPDTEG